MKSCLEEFRTVNSWRVCTCAPGAQEIIVPNRNDTLSHLVTKRGRTIVGHDSCSAWLADHPDALHAYNLWLERRHDAVGEWKHSTPHHRYNCDGGCLAVRVNGVKIMVGNGLGDGNYPVYVIRDSRSINCDTPAPDVLPHTFELTDTSVEADTPMTVEILDYDCDGGMVVDSFHATSVYFYVDREGAVVVKYVC